MPYCLVSGGGGGEEEVRIFYQRYGHGGTKVLLITGLAGTHESWAPQVKGLTGATDPADEESPAAGVNDDDDGAENVSAFIEACCFDNRGAGLSSSPARRSGYTTSAMARDALALMDHLGWRRAHVVGHSMGSMVAAKLAAAAPSRVASLALLGATGGGYQCVPNLLDWRTLSLAYRFLRAATPEQRAAVDLEAHYTREYLDEPVSGSSLTRRETLYHEYVRGLSSASSSGGMQSRHGFEGQMHACWTHELSPEEMETIRSAGLPVLIIHGRDDVVAQLCHARTLAEKLRPAARMVELHGGHMVSHERPAEVNMFLMEMIKASRSNIDLEEWSEVPDKKSDDGLICLAGSSAGSLGERESYLTIAYNLVAKIQCFGAFYVILEHARRVVGMLMPPVRMPASAL
ncbi:hypothetical protein EJB05_03913, partial [Eragrostis curvula]